MPFEVRDCVGIRTVRDTGVVAEVLQNSTYDVDRDQVQATGRFAEAELFLLTPGKTIKVRERLPVGEGRFVLLISHYRIWKGHRRVVTRTHRIAPGGHNMGRFPR